MSIYFLFYGYVYINCQQQEALIYNTISKQTVEIDNRLLINELNKLVSSPTSFYIISIDEENFTNEVEVILKRLELGFYGELIRKEYAYLPIQLSPRVMIRERDIDIYDGNKNMISAFVSDLREYNDHIGRNILSNVLELTIHYSNLSNFASINNYRMAFLQYHFPRIGQRNIMEINTLKRVFSCDLPNLGRINLILGTLWEKDINELVKDVLPLLAKYANDIYIYISLADYQKIDKYIDARLKHVYIWCNPYEYKNEVKRNHTSVICLVTNYDEILYLEKSVVDKVPTYYLLYTGKNKEYCVNELAFNIDEINSLECTEKMVMQNMSINTNFWGELVILPNGDVYSCINCDRVGNVLNESMRLIIWNELTVTKNWFMSRKKVCTCVNCKYNWLCPPITNIELALGNWTLCGKKNE